MTSRFKAVIPARYASTRFPGKPLQPICGKAMIIHVCERAVDSGAEQVVVATDDHRIIDTVEAAGFQAVMTHADHKSGTDRIAEVAESKNWSDDTIIVNIQGDEPLVAATDIQSLISTLQSQSKADVATLSTTIINSDELTDTNIVKVVTNQHGYALYFSRATIPWDRDGFSHTTQLSSIQHQRHLGLYAYRAGFLKRFVTMQAAPIELLEKLEQLRILWNAEPIIVTSVQSAPAPGVDTPEDLIRVEQILLNKKQSGSRL
ncbi:MAG TPA: 3-deoxy-manno-octulosonate cytidylyltransferase [Crenotrichaceae bacterium]|nr:3-deoxy-manno-octulosonate cytidylyltransferase [Crenotrichaceae bacterium]